MEAEGEGRTPFHHRAKGTQSKNNVEGTHSKRHSWDSEQARVGLGGQTSDEGCQEVKVNTRIHHNAFSIMVQPEPQRPMNVQLGLVPPHRQESCFDY